MRHVDISFAGAPLCTAEVADGMVTRARGLLGRGALPQATGLLIQPCSSVHTWFMAFALDVVYLDAELVVVKIAHNLKPFRFSWGGRGAKAALEVAAGTIPDTLVPGNRLTIVSANTT